MSNGAASGTINGMTDAAQTAEDLADEVVGHLLRHPDATQRYTALRLVDERMPFLRAATIKQLEMDLGGIGAAADALGISRQSATETYAKTGTPGPRADKDRTNHPAYLYGRWLAWCAAVAAAADELEVYEKLETNAARTTTVYPPLRRRAQRWRRASVDLPEPDVDDAVAQLGTRHLTTAEQADVYLGFHHARAGR